MTSELTPLCRVPSRCASYKAELGGSPLTVLVKLFDPLLGGDIMVECLLEADDGAAMSDAFAAPLLMLSYLVLSAVLLLNMLIAMMANTFDDIWSEQQVYYQMVLSQMELQYKAQQEREGAPAPLTLLTHPFRLLRLLRH